VCCYFPHPPRRRKMPSLSFFKRRKPRDRQHSVTAAARDDGRPEPGGDKADANAGVLTAPADEAKGVGEDDGGKPKARLARRGSATELIRGFLGNPPRGHRRDLDSAATGRSSPSWTPSGSAASTPLLEYHRGALRSEHQGELGHGLEREREREREPEATTATKLPLAPRENPGRRPRPVSAIAANPNVASSLPGRWKSQRLKRLQSLAFKPRSKKDKKKAKETAAAAAADKNTPQVTDAPATAAVGR
jgi:hypothetical protein